MLEDKVRALTHENINLRNRIELENSIEKISYVGPHVRHAEVNNHLY